MTTGTFESSFGPVKLLRWMGTLAMLCAGALFLFEGVEDTAVFRRELLWAAVTVALSVLGILTARGGRDPSSARVLLGLAAATIPVHFAQVGAQIWAHQEGSEPTDSLTIALLGGVLLLVLGPPLSIGVSALVRGRGVALTALLFLLSAPLLVPTRSGDFAGACAVIAVGVLVALEWSVFRHDPRMKTLEGMSARAMLVAPLVILLLRGAYHPASTGWHAALFVVPSVVLLALPHLVPIPRGALVQSCAVVGIGAGCAIALRGYEVLGVALALVGLLGTRAVRDEPQLFAWLGAGIFVLDPVLGWAESSLGRALVHLLVGVLFLAGAYRWRSAALVLVSGLGLGLGIAGQLAPLFTLPEHGRWLLVAVLGLLLLGAGTLAERHRERLHMLWLTLSEHFRPSAPAPEPTAPYRSPESATS